MLVLMTHGGLQTIVEGERDNHSPNQLITKEGFVLNLDSYDNVEIIEPENYIPAVNSLSEISQKIGGALLYVGVVL